MSSRNMQDYSILTDIIPSSKDGKAILPALVSLTQDFQEKFLAMFADLRSEFGKLAEYAQSQEAKISQMDGEMKALKLQLIKMEEKVEDNDNYERRDTLVLSGNSLPPIQNNEICSQIVISMVKDVLKVNISPADISTAHRLNSRKNANQKDVIVKFCRRNIKTDILTACRRVKPANFFINEFLTPQRQTIAFVLRKAKKELPNIVSGSTTFEGRNFVWVKPPNPSAPGAKDSRVAINSYSRLVEFCTKTLQKPLTHFISEWSH